MIFNLFKKKPSPQEKIEADHKMIYVGQTVQGANGNVYKFLGASKVTPVAGFKNIGIIKFTVELLEGK
jgi:hypothetical protein